MSQRADKSISERERLLSAISQSGEALKAQVQKQGSLENSFGKLKEEYEAEINAHKEDEVRLKQLRDQITVAKELISAKTLLVAQISMQLNQLETQVLDRYRLSLAELLPKYEDMEYGEEKVARQNELQKVIDEMGDVNLTAIEEYQDLEKRFLFLDEQKEDLEESLRSLQKAIQRINKTTRKRFLETFHLVNEKFQEVFLAFSAVGALSSS